MTQEQPQAIIQVRNTGRTDKNKTENKHFIHTHTNEGMRYRWKGNGKTLEGGKTTQREGLESNTCWHNFKIKQEIRAQQKPGS